MTSLDLFPLPDDDSRDDMNEQPRDDAADQPPLADESPTPDFDSEQWLEMFLTDNATPGSDLSPAPDDAVLPESDHAPGIVRETPVGGRLPPDSGGYALPVPPAEDDAAQRDLPTPQDLAAELPALETPPLSEHEAPEPPASAAEELVETIAQPVVELAAEPTVEPAVEPTVEPAVETVRSRAPESEAGNGPAAAPGDAATPTSPDTRTGTPPAEPIAPPAPAPAASVARAEDWDEDLSPELAAVLFGAASARPAPASSGAAQPASPAEPAPLAVRAQPSAESPAKPAGPVMVTTPGEARSRPLVAGEFTAPAPEATIQGRMRYVRVEEPLRGDRGRHIHETWEFFGPDYPALDGRLVKRMESEEFAYADGSWKLIFRRDYSQGRDERTVRIASDGEYAERTDRIQRRDAMSNKTRREREQVGLRYAAPPTEEKRGFLSSLFGRGDGPQAEGPKSWRPVTEAEMRDARRDGGAAFHYRLFEKP